MKPQLGIFQEQEQINTYLASKGIGHDDIQIAGPFPTRLQAVQWMDFIEKRMGQGKMDRHAVGLMNQRPWYGLTFVPREVATGRQQRSATKFAPMSVGLR
jgi:hypothetical protein